jgi:hypothetical protein
MQVPYLRKVSPAAVVALALLGASPAMAQSASGASAKAPAAKGKYAVPRTADGKPDMQGVWDFRTVTPMERPTELAGKTVLTDEEAAEFETKNARNQDNREQTARGSINGAPTNSDVERAYNDFWWDFGKKVVGTKQTSLVVDPPDGRIPAITPEGQARAAERRAARERPAQGPEDRGVGERCLLGFNSGPPMLPSAYNNNFLMVQSKDHVVIVNEMVHNSRVVPLDGRPHVSKDVRQWVGDSRGRWDGDTLVVETTNFLGETAFQNSSANLTLTEHFTRVDAETLLYEFAVNDPTTWTKPWTARVPMRKSNESMYEYACHEGNYGMPNLLSAARAVEKAPAVPPKKGSN